MDKDGKKSNFHKKKPITKTKHIGLPKMRVKKTSGKISKNKKRRKKTTNKKISQDTKFVPLNATNVNIVKEYCETISKSLYDALSNSGEYVLYQYENISRDIFLVPTTMTKYVKKMARNFQLVHAGIHLGYMRRKRTRTGFERAFFLSYEGGEFIYSVAKDKYPEIHKDLQSIKINSIGEKAFLYGRSIEMENILSNFSSIIKKKIIFVFDRLDNYIGLALLRVKQAGIKRPDDVQGRQIDQYSRSQNFTLSLMTLTDSGYYLRKGG